MSRAYCGRCNTAVVVAPRARAYCPVCGRRLITESEEVQRRLGRMEEASWDAYKSELRRRDAPRAAAEPVRAVLPGEREFVRDDPGHPLGRGFPAGRSLRLDGETHRRAWMRVLRQDPCAFCGERPAGTVDHIEPQSRPARGLGGAHSWVNYTGACERCNGRKTTTSLLMFLAVRAGCAGAYLDRTGWTA